MSHGEPPRLARLLLRLQGLGNRRDEIAADLRELFEIRAREQGPIAFATAALVLLITAVVAVLVPVRRAMDVDPASVLRAM